MTGHLELSEDGKAMKYFELAPFDLRLDADVISALGEDGAEGDDMDTRQTDQEGTSR